MMTGVSELDDGIERTVEWLKEIEYMLSPCERREAYLAWLAVVVPLRDQMQPAAVLQLGQLLPAPLRGVFFDGWRIGEPPAEITPAEFLQTVAARLPTGFPWPPEPVVRAVFEGLVESVPPDAVSAVLEGAPASLGAYWPKHV